MDALKNFLFPVETINSNEKSLKAAQRNFETAQKEVLARVDIIQNANKLPEVNALLKAFEDTCENGECYTVIGDIRNKILLRLKDLKENSINNSSYRPAKEEAA